MAAVRSKNTSPEIVLRRALYAAGIRGWRCHYRSAPGTPDIAFVRKRVAIFIDGAFWHGHPSRHRPGRSGKYWDDKIARNVERDRRVDLELRGAGWVVLRFWDFDVRKDLATVVDRIASALETVREPAPHGTSSGASRVQSVSVRRSTHPLHPGLRDQGA